VSRTLARGTQPIPREAPAPQVVVEKVVHVNVVVEPRVLQVLVLPESKPERAQPPAPVSEARARRVTDAYRPVDPEPRKPLAIA